MLPLEARRGHGSRLGSRMRTKGREWVDAEDLMSWSADHQVDRRDSRAPSGGSPQSIRSLTTFDDVAFLGRTEQRRVERYL